MNIKELLSQKSALLVSFQNLPQFRCDDSLNVFQLLISTLKSLHSRDSLASMLYVEMSELEWKEVCSASVQSLSVFPEVPEAGLNVILSIADFIPICVMPDLLSHLSSHMISRLCQYYYEKQDRERCKLCVLGLKEGIIESGKIFAECADSTKDWLVYSHSVRAYLNEVHVLETDPCAPLIRIFSNLSTGTQYQWTISYLNAILSFLMNSSEMDYVTYHLLMDNQDSSDLISILEQFISVLLKVRVDQQVIGRHLGIFNRCACS